MRENIKYLGIVFVFATLQLNAQVQDLSFSQYFNFPALQEPTFAGESSAGYRVTGIYRQQWKTIDAQFQTFGVAGDIAIAKKLFQRGTFGVGFYAIDDHLGNDIITHQKAGLSLAFHKPLDFQERHRLSLGINGNYSSSTINYDLLTFESQYNGFILNTELPTGEAFENDQIKNINIGAGLGYGFILSSKDRFSANVSLLQILAPNEYFLSSDSREELTNRWVGSLSWQHLLNTRMALVPSLQIVSFQKATDFRIGVISEFRGLKKVDIQLNGGLFYQLQKAITLYAGVDYRNYSIHASYDFTASPLNNVTDASDQSFKKPGALEVSLTMRGLIKNAKKEKAVPCRFF